MCQFDTLDSPSWGREVTYETIPISIANLKPQLQFVVLCDVIASSLFSDYCKPIHHMVTIFRSEVIMIWPCAFE